MIITTKKQLNIVLREERLLYISQNKKQHLINLFEQPLSYRIWKWQKRLRICEYWQNRKGIISHLIFRYHKRKLFSTGNKLHIEIYPGCFGKGLKIYHTGIIVNNHAQIKNNCQLHGLNCIGNKGITDACPQIGKELNLGIGACVIGDVQLGDNITIGANSVVTKSFSDNTVIVGIPGRILCKI